MNQTRKSILLHVLSAAGGLILFGFGVYLTIQASLGVAPWDIFNLGLSKTIGISYGDAAIAVSLFILLIDILLKEKIGIGMFLDAFIVGKTVDLCQYLNLVPARETVFGGVLTMLIGMAVMGFSQFLYMRAGLGCGPRDTLLVGLSRKLPKIPIGVISVCILATVTVAGVLLGGPIGIGTLMAAGLEGLIMQGEFKLLRFDATHIPHQSVMDSCKILFRK